MSHLQHRPFKLIPPESRHVAALTLKSLANTITRFNKLTPAQIACLNHIRLSTVRKHDPFWKYGRGGFNPKMTESEALLVLGIENDEVLSLTYDQLKKKHRRMMLLNHPDKGGSPYLAMKINAAKDVLERSYMFRKYNDDYK
ncbi:unnamed protein product [Ambrosiozyma monospora]|uniref:Unnamed protein product n=1 Tax=Ambrosiozyma monospora TaxID=43982 RepID=A0ACB5ST13_AMBMO|nr:unnamed protein product [Ambrosiozyma monospora]